MRKDELTSEELFLKEGDNSAKLPLVDVHDSVMQAIGLGNDRFAINSVPPLQEADIPDIMHRMEPATYAKRCRKRMWSRPVRRWAAVLILVVLVGGSYSLFKESPWQAAKFQYEVLPYEPLLATKEGGTIEVSKNPLVPSKVKIPQRVATKEEELLSEKNLEAYRVVEKLLLPGEGASYVLKKEGAGDERPQLGRVIPAMLFNDYSSYLAKAEEYKAPYLPRPEYLPEGYVFDQAWIQPDFEVNENELLTLTDGIKLEGGYRVMWKKEPTARINYEYSSMRYKKGESMVRINAKHIKAKTGTVESLLRTNTTNVENILVNGTQLIYTETTNIEIKLGYRYRLVWTDPEQNVVYDMTAAPESSSLTKEEVIRIAADMMK
ncbi:DUF4367 domain-containing protein [Paenibacillus sp. FSL E2-0177]|uniref:DUF4367 domain-containing protein n=1 Tax=Paenibacillus sp. FSL E2-0177 TaxID=2921360 RepID=UPI0030ED0A84